MNSERTHALHNMFRYLCICIAVLGLGACLAPPQSALVIYNHSPSMPVGFYVRAGARLTHGVIVTVRAIDAAPREARRRRFDAADDFFIKRIAALGGDTVCARGDALEINGHLAVIRLAHDSQGRELSRWNECRRLRADEVLLLGDAIDSFDGRYWGPISIGCIRGVWRLLAR